jgi:hypothetical protein
MARCGLAGNRSRALEPVQFHLATRNPKELVGMVDAWQRFSTAFAEPLRRTNLSDGSGTVGTPSGAACQVHFGSSLARPNDVNLL